MHVKVSHLTLCGCGHRDERTRQRGQWPCTGLCEREVMPGPNFIVGAGDECRCVGVCRKEAHASVEMLEEGVVDHSLGLGCAGQPARLLEMHV
jgi:hypothetical protein